MEFSQVVANRHSVRDFTDQPVSQEDLVDVVRTAQQAPSWVNSQPWRVYAAPGPRWPGSRSAMPQTSLPAGRGTPTSR
nr:nitroreductase family protein [Actinomyces oris]